MSVKLYTNFRYNTEVLDVAKLFFDNVELSSVDNADIVHIITVGSTIDNCVSYNGISTSNSVEAPCDALHNIRLQKRYAKITLYNCLQQACSVSQPWGCLTGIRPTKLAYQLVEEGLDYKDTFASVFSVSDSKIQLVDSILQQQEGLRIIDDKQADMYIGIPFCKTRCSYCSFTSGQLDKLSKYVDSYVDTLIHDIIASQEIATKHGLHINNLYIGGGTPTTLTASQLDKVMSAVQFVPNEYCVEAGRPDTIDKDKFDIMAKHNVNRVSINPQSFDDNVLQVIGRGHTSQDIIECYQLARQYDFDINMDFIAGLPSDSYHSFCKSIDRAIELSPENITVHTLAIKQGSVLSQTGICDNGNIIDMVDYARDTLMSNGYYPYYMYRQKYMRDNLENVGYCKSGKQCQYNINIMEETNNIIACGANAISKRVYEQENRIERCANAKDVITYIASIEQYLAKKAKLFG